MKSEIYKIKLECLSKFFFLDLRMWTAGFWIGGYDMGHEGKFVWFSTGRPVNGYTNWRLGEPNNKNDNENCLTMLINGRWNDEPCLTERAFICEDLPTKN